MFCKNLILNGYHSLFFDLIHSIDIMKNANQEAGPVLENLAGQLATPLNEK